MGKMRVDGGVGGLNSWGHVSRGEAEAGRYLRRLVWGAAVLRLAAPLH